MELIGKIFKILEPVTGEGKNGTWKKQDFVITVPGQYPKNVCFSIWGDKVDFNQLNIGQQVKVMFDVESREYNGKWYSDIKAWRVDVDGSSEPSTFSKPQAKEDAPVSFSQENDEYEDDLPF